LKAIENWSLKIQNWQLSGWAGGVQWPIPKSTLAGSAAFRDGLVAKVAGKIGSRFCTEFKPHRFAFRRRAG
jgi:hypothetical protein